MMLGLLFIGGIFFQYNPRGRAMIEKFEKDGMSIKPDERFGYTLRLMSWDAGFDLVLENPITGVGIGDVTSEMSKIYLIKRYNTPMKQKLNAHNEFLQITLETGIIGLFLVLSMFYYLFKSIIFDGKYYFLNLGFLFIMLVGFLFESVLNRYSGISFFMLFYCLIIAWRPKVPKINDGY